MVRYGVSEELFDVFLKFSTDGNIFYSYDAADEVHIYSFNMKNGHYEVSIKDDRYHKPPFDCFEIACIFKCGFNILHRKSESIRINKLSVLLSLLNSYDEEAVYNWETIMSAIYFYKEHDFPVRDSRHVVYKRKFENISYRTKSYVGEKLLNKIEKIPGGNLFCFLYEKDLYAYQICCNDDLYIYVILNTIDNKNDHGLWDIVICNNHKYKYGVNDVDEEKVTDVVCSLINIDSSLSLFSCVTLNSMKDIRKNVEKLLGK